MYVLFINKLFSYSLLIRLIVLILLLNLMMFSFLSIKLAANGIQVGMGKCTVSCKFTL